MPAKTSPIVAAAQLATGSQETTEKKPRPTVRPPLPEAHSDVALLDIKDVCALTRMSASWIHAEVAAGRFPPPIRFGMRCARFSAASVRQWLIDRVEKAAADSQVGERVTARAKKASAAAQAKRALAAASAAQ